MESDEFNKQALELIHHSQKDHESLLSSIKKLLKGQFFKSEKVLVDQEPGKIIGVYREESPSNKENQPRYNVETQKSILNVPISRLTRVNPPNDVDLVAYIKKVAERPNSSWTVYKKYLDKYRIKDKVHPFFVNMKRSSSSDKQTSTPPKKPRLDSNGAGTSKPNDNSSSDDDGPVMGAIRKSGVGLAPHSAAAKMTIKKLTQKSPKKPSSSSKPSKPSKSSKSSKSSKPKSKKETGQNGVQKSPSKPPKVKKEAKDAGKTKKSKKSQMNLSDFFTPAKSTTKSTPHLSYEEKMINRAKNINKQAIKAIVNIDIPALTKLMESAANSFPERFVKEIPNSFVQYLYHKSLVKHQQKGKDATERAKIREENKSLRSINEFLYLQRKLTSGKFEDTWIEANPLPEFPIIDRNQSLLFRCIRLSAFLQSYRQMLEIKKLPSIFDFIDSLSGGVDGFWKVTAPILVQVTMFIRKYQRTIPHFNSGYLNYQIKTITIRSVHQIARKILNPDYSPNAVIDDEDQKEEEENSISVSSRASSVHPEENGVDKREEEENGVEKKEEDSDEEEAVEVNQQSKEDDELCERFCSFELYELTPLDQARILELLIERVEASGPVRDSMRNIDGEVRKLKETLASKQKKIEKLNKDLEEVPPLIPEEDYVNYSRAQTISVVKSNRKRRDIESKIEDIEDEITLIRETIEEMRGCSRFRATPLGYDRFHRRYWFFQNTPGILVEQGAWTVKPPDEKEPLALPSKPKVSTYDMSTEQLFSFMHTLVGGGYPSDCVPVKWFHINSVDLLNKLIDNLNPKGIRETQLKETIQKSRAVIEVSFKQRS